MTVVVGEGWMDDDAYWSGFSDEEFLEYLTSCPEPDEPIVYDDSFGKPWPMSVERRSWHYDDGGFSGE